MENKQYTLSCGCVPDASGYGYCDKCTKALRQKIWNKMSEKQRRYDRHFAPDESDELDRGLPEEYNTSCSCHINPPCRKFSRLRAKCTAPEIEKSLAYWSVNKIIEHGGVLEHPSCSTLWKEVGLPLPGHRPVNGLYSISLDQFWFGHPCKKNTWLLIKGIDINELPAMPFKMGEPEFVVSTSRRKYGKKRAIPKSKRSSTPPDFAKWLMEVVRKIRLTDLT